MFSAIPRFPDHWCDLTICLHRGADVTLDGGFHAALFDSIPSSAVVEAFRHHLFFLCWRQIRRFSTRCNKYLSGFTLPDVYASCPLAYPCTGVPYSCLCQSIIKSFQSVSGFFTSCFCAAVLRNGRPTFFLSGRLHMLNQRLKCPLSIHY